MKFNIISEGKNYTKDRAKSLKVRLEQIKDLDFIDSDSFEAGYLGDKKGSRWSKGSRNNVNQLSSMAGAEAWKQDKSEIKNQRDIDGKKADIDDLSKELEELEPEEKVEETEEESTEDNKEENEKEEKEG